MRFKAISARIFFLFFIFSFHYAYTNPALKRKKVSSVDSLQVSVDYLNKLLSGQGGWKLQNEDLKGSLQSLIHFAEDEKVDSVLVKLSTYRNSDANSFFYRDAELVQDSLKIPGYISSIEMEEQMKRIDREVRNSVVKDGIAVPEQLLENLDSKVRTLAEDEGYLLLRDSLVVLPDSIQSFDAIPDSLIMSPSDFQRIQRMDSLKRVILEEARQKYNNNVLQYYIDSVSEAYRTMVIHNLSFQEQAKYRDLVQQQNKEKLVSYNEGIMKQVNDSVMQYLNVLISYAESEPTMIWVQDSKGDSTEVWLGKDIPFSKRMYIRNEQNDSLGIRIRNLDRNAMQILIDDGVSFNRFSQQQSKSFKFDKLVLDNDLRKVNKKYDVTTPWTLGGDGTVGFTQTYLNNWKKGGKSALSTLTVLKGFANYSLEKIKWENSAEIRNGWLKPGGEKIQKNDDKFELISRFGVSAFKKWYYSAEVDFETQFFYGYNYPNREKPISGFLAPAKTLIKFGLDYKPNKNFSLFLSPFTSKTVYVRDTVKIDATKFGIEPGKKRYWEPGLNADLKWKKEITPDLTYETKYKMFINYSSPFSKFDINWENNLVMRLNDFINMRVLLHFVYDDNVKFPVYREVNGENVEVGKEPKWQVKELITVGFSYKLNKRIYKRKLLN